MNYRKITASVFLSIASLTAYAYTDHRGHNLDSLERVVSVWTQDEIDNAPVEKKLQLYKAFNNLMWGYEAISSEKAVYYARKARTICLAEAWPMANSEMARHIGQYFYTKENVDSALFWYRESLAWADRMILGGSSPDSPDGYSERDTDDIRSQLYGTIGNLYSISGNIPEAMNWYDKAGEIFSRYGWNESNSTLHYNIGETWLEEKEYGKALQAYEKSMEYAYAAGDSLLAVNACKGLGSLYMVKGRTWKALKYLRMADEYYSAHPNEGPTFRTENLEYIGQVLSAQKKQLFCAAAILVALIILALFFIFRRKKLCPPLKQRSTPADEMTSVGLSEREKAILSLLAAGKTTPQIAEAVCLSNETIRWYRKKLLAKFDVSNTPELISKAKEKGLV